MQANGGGPADDSPELRFTQLPFDAEAKPVGELMEGYAHDTPKEAIVSFYLNDIVAVNVVDETWSPSLALTVDWTDDGAMESDGEGGYAFKVDVGEGGAGICKSCVCSSFRRDHH